MIENKISILVVDDELPIRRFLKTALSSHGYNVLEARSGSEALNAVASVKPNLVILDLGLPDMDGINVIHELRSWSHIPIIILSVREKEVDKVAALDGGADDYLTKPFGVRELIARVHVAERHMDPAGTDPIYKVKSLKVDLAKHSVKLGNSEISLTPTEYEVLKVLIQHAGQVITHHQLLKEAWGDAYEDESHMLRVNISNLRHKLEEDTTQPYYILTEPGVGYRMRDEACNQD